MSLLNKQYGFTILEVLVALIIVGLVMGSLFAIMGGSKRLAFRAMDSIQSTLFLRSALSSAQWLEEPKYPETPPHYAEGLKINNEDVLEKPERQTQKIVYALEPYQIDVETTDAQFVMRSVRWKRLDAAQ